MFVDAELEQRLRELGDVELELVEGQRFTGVVVNESDGVRERGGALKEEGGEGEVGVGREVDGRSWR